MSGRRADRVGKAMRDAIAEMLLREVKDPRVGLVSITRVSLSDDLRQARVLFSCIGDAAAAERSLAGLRSASGFMKAQLLRRLKLRYAPELLFVFDPSLADVNRLAALMRDTDSPTDDE